jgi:signal transduction histidine kinase
MKQAAKSTAWAYQPGVCRELLGTRAMVIFAALSDHLRRGVNRLMHGERDDPYNVLSSVGERVEATFAPNAALPTIAETVVQALELPFTAITLKQGEEIVEASYYGDKQVASEAVLGVPLTYKKRTVEELLLSPRTHGESITKADLQLLENLSSQVRVAAHVARLTAELQRLRELLVTAREEERRRLRRDLHDGVGPQLAALTLKLETACSLVSHDPETSSLIADLIECARTIVSDVRCSVHALRPPALDDLGLIPALREGAAQYSQNGLCVSVEAPEDLPPLPAALEVTAYRIAQEAMTNVVRHARARTCTVRIGLNKVAGMLRLEVEDDGRGLGEEHKSGVGMHSMCERAEELGGRCDIESQAAGGTFVSVLLPC